MPCIRIALICSFCVSVICYHLGIAVVSQFTVSTRAPPRPRDQNAVWCYKRAVFTLFCVKNRRFSIRFLTKPRMYTAADKTCVSIWKSTINQHFRFTVHSISQLLSGSRLTGGPAISRFFTREGPTVFCSVSRRDSDPPPGAAPSPRPRPVDSPLSRSQYLYSGV